MRRGGPRPHPAASPRNRAPAWPEPGQHPRADKAGCPGRDIVRLSARCVRIERAASILALRPRQAGSRTDELTRPKKGRLTGGYEAPLVATPARREHTPMGVKSALISISNLT